MITASVHIDGIDRPFGAEIMAAFVARGAKIVAGEASDTIDILVVNRPVTPTSRTAAQVTDDDFDAAMTDMLFDVVEIVQACLPRLSPGGRIVFVGSRGYLGAWGGVHLMAASGALAGLMRTMALEFAGRNIAVNLVAAGFIGTPWDTPASRYQVANAVKFLAEADTGLVGETIIVDGGRSLRMSESRNQ